MPAKTDTFSFKVPALEELSTLEVANLDSIIGNNRVLLLLDEAYNLKQAIPIAGDKVLFQLLPAGKYRLAVLEDLNIDLKPTPSNFKNRTQPETVHKHSETVVLRSNWEHEVQFSETK